MFFSKSLFTIYRICTENIENNILIVRLLWGADSKCERSMVEHLLEHFLMFFYSFSQTRQAKKSFVIWMKSFVKWNKAHVTVEYQPCQSTPQPKGSAWNKLASEPRNPLQHSFSVRAQSQLRNCLRKFLANCLIKKMLMRAAVVW